MSSSPWQESPRRGTLDFAIGTCVQAIGQPTFLCNPARALLRHAAIRLPAAGLLPDAPSQTVAWPDLRPERMKASIAKQLDTRHCERGGSRCTRCITYSSTVSSRIVYAVCTLRVHGAHVKPAQGFLCTNLCNEACKVSMRPRPTSSYAAKSNVLWRETAEAHHW